MNDFDSLVSELLLPRMCECTAFGVEMVHQQSSNRSVDNDIEAVCQIGIQLRMKPKAMSEVPTM